MLPDAGVVSPRGDVSEMGAARFFRRTGEGVYDMADLARATAKMASFVDGIKAQHPGRPVYGFGYSNGANILASVMIARPDLFDRVGLLHPLIPWTPDLSRADLVPCDGDENVGGVRAGRGGRGDLVAADADGDVAERAQGPDDLADAVAGGLLQVA